jgi:hypothetical protein
VPRLAEVACVAPCLPRSRFADAEAHAVKDELGPTL